MRLTLLCIWRPENMGRDIRNMVGCVVVVVVGGLWVGFF